MAQEKFIEGKHDEAHHDGRRGGLRRLFESEQELVDFWTEFLWPELAEAVLKGTLEEENTLQEQTPSEG